MVPSNSLSWAARILDRCSFRPLRLCSSAPGSCCCCVAPPAVCLPNPGRPALLPQLQILWQIEPLAVSHRTRISRRHTSGDPGFGACRSSVLCYAIYVSICSAFGDSRSTSLSFTRVSCRSQEVQSRADSRHRSGNRTKKQPLRSPSRRRCQQDRNRPNQIVCTVPRQASPPFCGLACAAHDGSEGCPALCQQTKGHNP